SQAEALGVLPPELLPFRRGRRGNRQGLCRLVRRRESRLLDRLPARRFQVPAGRRGVPQVAALGGISAPHPVGQLLPPLQLSDLREPRWTYPLPTCRTRSSLPPPVGACLRPASSSRRRATSKAATCSAESADTSR